MPTTRSAARAAASPITAVSDEPRTPKKTGKLEPVKPKINGIASARLDNPNKSTWADSHGAGDHQGAWGIKGSAGVALSYSGIFLLMFCCPGFSIYMCVPLLPSSCAWPCVRRRHPCWEMYWTTVTESRMSNLNCWTDHWALIQTCCI